MYRRGPHAQLATQHRPGASREDSMVLQMPCSVYFCLQGLATALFNVFLPAGYVLRDTNAYIHRHIEPAWCFRAHATTATTARVQWLVVGAPFGDELLAVHCGCCWQPKPQMT